MNEIVVEVQTGSIEYVNASVTGDVTLDTQAVAMAIMAVGTKPTAGDWVAAAWTGVAGTTRSCRRLLAGTEAAGLYRVFVKVTDTPEVPVLAVAGILAIA